MLATLVTAPRNQLLRQAVAQLLPGDQLVEPIRSSGVAVYQIGIAGLWQAPLAVVRLAGLIRHLRPRVIQSWVYYADLVSLWALEMSGRRPKTRLYWGIRCSYLDFSNYGWILQWTMRACARRASRPDAIVANSYVGRDIHRKLGYRTKSFFVIPNGVDAERFRPDPQARAKLRNDLGIQNEQGLVIHVARVDPIKNHRLLLAVAQGMPSLRFLAVGQHTEKLNGPPNVLGLGLRRDVPQLLAAADALVMTSDGEGFPNVVAEAMAAGLPVVSTDAGDARRIVGDTGTIVPPRDRDAMIAALRDLFEHPDGTRQDRGMRARARIDREFSLRSYVAAFDALHLRDQIPVECDETQVMDAGSWATR